MCPQRVVDNRARRERAAAQKEPDLPDGVGLVYLWHGAAVEAPSQFGTRLFRYKSGFREVKDSLAAKSPPIPPYSCEQPGDHEIGFRLIYQTSAVSGARGRSSASHGGVPLRQKGLPIRC